MRSSEENNPAIMCDEPISEVQLINNDGQKIIKGEHAHIREFTPLTQIDQRSYQNTDDEDAEAGDKELIGGRTSDFRV